MELPLGNVSIVCFSASYLVAFGLEWTRLAGRTAVGRAVTLLFGLAGFVAHTAYLLTRATHAHLPPLLSSTHDWLLVLAWLAILFYLFLSALQRDLPVGLFLLPLVLLLIGSAYVVRDIPSAAYVADAAAEKEALRGWRMLHSALLVFGMGGVILGFVLSMMYLVQHRQLKRKHVLQEGLALPSLARLARWNWWAIVVSVPLLTLGMLSGVCLIFLSRGAPHHISWGDPIVVASGLVWLVMMAFFCWLLWTPRTAGKQVAWLTIWAFGFLLATVLGLQMLTGGHATAAGAGQGEKQSADGWPPMTRRLCELRMGGRGKGLACPGQGTPREDAVQSVRHAWQVLKARPHGDARSLA
jgi:ABC-type uncharacterized transport system permease subunit